MNKNELQFLKKRIDNLRNKLEIAQGCINSAVKSLDKSDNLLQLINFHYNKMKNNE